MATIKCDYPLNYSAAALIRVAEIRRVAQALNPRWETPWAPAIYHHDIGDVVEWETHQGNHWAYRNTQGEELEVVAEGNHKPVGLYYPHWRKLRSTSATRWAMEVGQRESLTWPGSRPHIVAIHFFGPPTKEVREEILLAIAEWMDADILTIKTETLTQR